MNKKVFYTIIYFLLITIALSSGKTFSFFTNHSVQLLNFFTTGTVLVEAGDIEGNLIVIGNGDGTWSPGECKELELTVENSGSKRAYVRARFEADWRATYFSNTATAKAYYEVPNQEPKPFTSISSAYYGYGNYSGESQDPEPDPDSYSYFTAVDNTSPLFFVSSYIIENTEGDNSSGNNSSGEPSDSSGGMVLSGNGSSAPTVNGLFYGDGDYQRYFPLATVPSGTTLYAYLEEQNGTRTLYVALVVSREVNDNVFDDGKTVYMTSADWTPPHPFNRMTDSEYMQFALECGDTTWTWRQGYADQPDDPKNNTNPTWFSSHLAGAGTGTPPPGYVSSSSLVWNLNNYAQHQGDPNVPKWDVTLGGTRPDFKTWKSPFVPGYPNDVTQVDGYPSTGQITYSETYGWEWAMVYEFSVDVTACNPYTLKLNNINSHHSPAKNDNETEYFEEEYTIPFPGISIIKEVSLDGGNNWYSETPWPELPDPLPDGFAPQFRFTLTNTGNVDLTDIEVTDDVFGVIGILSLLEEGNSHVFTYADYEWADRLELDNGNVSFELCEGMDGWVEWVDGYFYYTEPLASEDTVTLCVRVCIADDPENRYEGAELKINAYVDAVQASNNAVDEVWPGHPPLND